MESPVFWDITLCNVLRMDYSDFFQPDLLLALFFDIKYGGNMFLQNSGLFYWPVYQKTNHILLYCSYTRNCITYKRKMLTESAVMLK
jgi:hypothetical protein